MFSIGMLSKTAGVKVPTIRYYEQIGLMSAPTRTPGNQRRYSSGQVERLAFIKHARELGFSLSAIAGLIELSKNNEAQCGEIDRLAKEHLLQVQSKIALLQNLELELNRIISRCSEGKVSECHVIESIARHELCLGNHDL